MAASAKLTPVGDTHRVDVKDYDSYAWVLLEDHPLRSYPTKYPPGLFNFLRRWYATVRGWWSERGLSLVCLFVMFLMVIQFLAHLPYGVSYLLATDLSDQVGLAQWPAEFGGRPSACISYEPRVHWDAVDRALNAGCAGIKADVWVQGDEVFVGDSSSVPGPNDTLDHVYLEPLMAKLDARNPAVVSSVSDNSPKPVGLFDHDSTQPFMLFLRLQSQMSTVWPHLVLRMASLSQKGYLSYTDGVQVIPRPVTIVVTGLTSSEVDFVKDIGHDGINGSILFEKSPDLDATGNNPENDNSRESENPSGSLQEPSSGLPFQMFSVTINFRDSIGSPRGGRFSIQQIERIKTQVHNAHQRGLRIRYEAIPCLPRMLRRIVWRILVHEGADCIEVDWTQCEGGWWRSLFTIGRRDGRSHGNK
ncbi:hypothetical protein P170DRAFT_437506 [Aspergillus steynii IBT 23096]|uniref:PLC-like phosphodiesterase n=1 Tax=Aspergillus steynii IBT 23096 TaxID=1392250 RepID=A0A2I2G4I1_9EURO|nr:uncharacterized protein P170DRAFT_437506 [Aspergillus steynii IBT 23096]PLB47769.1 hypothetical protein P170DRAFT_437506 [Aspergillus steynii IBT 23096]